MTHAHVERNNGNAVADFRQQLNRRIAIRTVELSWDVASRISGATVFGSIWRSARRISLIPIDFVASTNGCSCSTGVLAWIDERDHGDQQNGDCGMTIGGRAKRPRHHQRQDLKRQSLWRTSEMLWNTRYTAATIARGQPWHADQVVERDRAEPDGQRYPRALNEAAEHVVAEGIRAHSGSRLNRISARAESTVSGS